jgi:hypothetical protein
MNSLPQFYAQAVPFDAAVHGQLRFSQIAPEFGFAAKADVIALMVSEVAQAVRHYPMVFLPGTSEAPPTLAVLVGLGDGVNRYVDAQGQWRAQTYIPAYVRRYPFLPMQGASQADPILAIDTTQGWIHTQADEPLVDSTPGQASPRLARVVAFLQEYEQQSNRTQDMCAALHAAAVLEPRTLTWLDQATNETRQLDGFWCVDEAKLKGLSAESLHTLHQADALGMAYAQLLSMSNLQDLVAAALTLPTQVQKPLRKKKAAGSAR